MSPIASLDAVSLDWPPDCIEFVPDRSNAFLVGTYFLNEDAEKTSPDEKQQRKGTLNLYRLENDHIIKETSIETKGGAYDLHFAANEISGTASFVGVAMSVGIFSIYSVQDDIKLQQHYKLAEQDVLITSFAWHPTLPNVIAATLSTGDVVVCTLDLGNMTTFEEAAPRSVQICQIAKHDEAAWQVVWDPTGNMLFHGGDDASLGWCKTPMDASSTFDNLRMESIEVASDRRVHSAGVTAILPLENGWILTGSYDDHMRVVKVPAQGRASCHTELKFSDGVFRLRFLREPGKVDADGSYHAIVLASCMRAGTRVVDVHGSSDDGGQRMWILRELAAFSDNESLNYASACQGEDIVSLSFYDKKAFLWCWPGPSAL